MARLMTGSIRLMRDAAAMMGARTTGIAATTAKARVCPRILKKARRFGTRLAVRT